MRLRYLPLCLLLLLPGSAPFWPKSEPDSVSGQVCDETGPVANARVRFKAQPLSVVTDASGNFSLPRPRAASDRVVAAKEGYFIAGASADSVPLVLTLQRLPGADFEDYAWVDSAPGRGSHNCGNCHGDIYREWLDSGHARSVTNRRFRNLYDGSDWQGRPNHGWNLLADNPDGAGVCTSCHAPTVGFSDPAYYDLRQTLGVAARGVHCDYCHKIADVEPGPLGLQHGRFGLKLRRPADGQLFYGPLDDVDRGDDAFAPLYRRSRYCASCHEGVVFGVHVYSTYSEWLDSPARREGKQCQTCHMAPTGTLTNMAPGKGGVQRDPQTLANHRFFAGSQADMLRQCLRVSVDLVPADGEVRAQVAVHVDGAGHRVPTGFIDRHLVLVVDGLNGETVVPVIRGSLLPAVAGRELAGRPGKLYARILHDFDGKTPAPFWRADPAVQDTRLVPGRTDRLTFAFPAKTTRVRVRLLYRRFWPEVTEAKGWPDDTIVVLDRTS
jgi:Cytochrome c554 and c-prime